MMYRNMEVFSTGSTVDVFYEDTFLKRFGELEKCIRWIDDNYRIVLLCDYIVQLKNYTFLNMCVISSATDTVQMVWDIKDEDEKVRKMSQKEFFENLESGEFILKYKRKEICNE